MRKKLEGNGLWESSRMMLPEHKDRIKNRKKVKQIKPELTEEEMQEMFGRLQASKANTLEVTLTIFYEYENKTITGVVNRF